MNEHNSIFPFLEKFYCWVKICKKSFSNCEKEILENIWVCVFTPSHNLSFPRKIIKPKLFQKKLNENNKKNVKKKIDLTKQCKNRYFLICKITWDLLCSKWDSSANLPSSIWRYYGVDWMLEELRYQFWRIFF